MKKLYRSSTDRMVAGICGGLAEYANVDVNIIRLLAVFGFLVTGIFPLGIVYIIAMFMVPEKTVSNRAGVVDGKTE